MPNWLNALSGIKDKLPQIEDISSRLESAYIELKDIYRETSCMEEDITFDQGRLDEITARLNTIYSLEQKHRKDSVEELLEIQNSLQEQLDRITSFDDDINALKEEIDKEYRVLTETGKELRESRLAAARDLEQKMTATLVTLGMPNVKFKVELKEREKPSENGLDSTTYLFSANKNQAMQDNHQAKRYVKQAVHDGRRTLGEKSPRQKAQQNGKRKVNARVNQRADGIRDKQTLLRTVIGNKSLKHLGVLLPLAIDYKGHLSFDKESKSQKK